MEDGVRLSSPFSPQAIGNRRPVIISLKIRLTLKIRFKNMLLKTD